MAAATRGGRLAKVQPERWQPLPKPRNSLMRLLGATVLVAALAVAGCGYLSPKLYRQRQENYVALSAKLLCSCAFVIGRDVEDFIEQDLTLDNPLVPDWKDIDVAIDAERKAVTLTLAGGPPRTAVFNGDQGCTLLPAGVDDVFFAPVSLTTTLPDAAVTPWPMGDVRSDAPLPAEVDGPRLDAALDAAFDEGALPEPQKTRAMVVVYRGRIIAERYAPGFEMQTRHIGWSMGKSITATLIGILVRDGHLRIEAPAPIAEWRAGDDPRAAITINDLLQMSSGLRFHRGTVRDGLILTERDHHQYVYFGAPQVFAYSLRRSLEFPPGTVWRYRNCDPLALGKIIRDTVEAQGADYLSFPHRALFDRLGMRHMVLEPDPWGNFIMTGFDYGTARDWARFGLLYLRDGVWQGEPVLPQGWAAYVATPAPASEEKAYGALFWLNAGGRYARLPRDMFWAAGYQGQRTMIIPSRDLVVVRLGHSDAGFDAYFERVIHDILTAVGPPPPPTHTMAVSQTMAG